MASYILTLLQYSKSQLMSLQKKNKTTFKTLTQTKTKDQFCSIDGKGFVIFTNMEIGAMITKRKDVKKVKKNQIFLFSDLDCICVVKRHIYKRRLVPK